VDSKAFGKTATWIGGHLTDSNFAGNRMHSGTQHWQRMWIAGHAADSKPNRLHSRAPHRQRTRAAKHAADSKLD
jgi:hypothetical protein